MGVPILNQKVYVKQKELLLNVTFEKISFNSWDFNFYKFHFLLVFTGETENSGS